MGFSWSAWQWKPLKWKPCKSGTHDSKDYDYENQKDEEPLIVPLPLKTYRYPSTDCSTVVHTL